MNANSTRPGSIPPGIGRGEPARRQGVVAVGASLDQRRRQAGGGRWYAAAYVLFGLLVGVPAAIGFVVRLSHVACGRSSTDAGDAGSGGDARVDSGGDEASLVSPRVVNVDAWAPMTPRTGVPSWEVTEVGIGSTVDGVGSRRVGQGPTN